MYNLTPLLIFFLLFFLIEIIFNLTFQIDFILSLAGSTIIFAVLEEYFKYIINPFLDYKRLNSIGSAIVNTLYIGLSFAFIENILFFIYSKGSPDFMTIYIYRSIFTTLLHVCASGLLGYFYGLSIFSKSIITNYEIEKSEYNILAPLREWLGVRKKSIFQSISVTQGFFVAGSVHAVFNLLIFLNLKIPSAILIIGLTLFVVYLLNLKSTQVQYGLVGTDTMPKEDFSQLRLQISVIQHLKEIQDTQNNPTTNNKTPPITETKQQEEER
ncbi:MAG: PrsW family glutamic-type intramembrane protease [Bacteroidota bacterium]|nr:PrsW family glutamic-type intramembrane protease [Bacteroidota bacterium]